MNEPMIYMVDHKRLTNTLPMHSARSPKNLIKSDAILGRGDPRDRRKDPHAPTRLFTGIPGTGTRYTSTGGGKMSRGPVPFTECPWVWHPYEDPDKLPKYRTQKLTDDSAKAAVRRFDT